MAFFYFTAFTAQFADLGGFTTEEYAHRYAAQIVAGVWIFLGKTDPDDTKSIAFNSRHTAIY